MARQLKFPNMSNEEAESLVNHSVSLAKYYLGAFFASQKTGLSGAPCSRTPAPATPWLNPSNPLRSQHPGKPGWAGYRNAQIPEANPRLNQSW
jgi:hypothetical protein